MRKLGTHSISKELIYGVLGFAASSTSFFPGFMSPDSLLQYSQSVSGKFGDWHPPAMAGLWRVFIAFKSPAPMLLLQEMLLWGSLIAIAKNFKKIKHHNLVFLVGVVPWVSNFSGVIWKDVWMAVLFLLGTVFALMVDDHRTRSTLFLISGCALSAIASVLFRHNGIFSAVPFFIFVSINIIERSKTQRLNKQIILPLVVVSWVLTSVFINQIIDYKILKSTHDHPENAFMIDDLLRLSQEKGVSLLPGISMQALKECENFLSGEDPYSGKISCLQKNPDWLQSRLATRSLYREWIKGVLAQPVEYFKFRILNFAFFLKSPGEKPWYFWHPGIDTNQYGFYAGNNQLTKLNSAYVHIFAYVVPFVFAPYFWLAVNIYLLYFVSNRRFKYENVTKVLLWSSLLNFVSLFMAAGGADVRYIYWSSMACSLVVILLLMHKHHRIHRTVKNFPGPRVKQSITLLTIFLVISGHWLLR